MCTRPFPIVLATLDLALTSAPFILTTSRQKRALQTLIPSAPAQRCVIIFAQVICRGYRRTSLRRTIPNLCRRMQYWFTKRSKPNRVQTLQGQIAVVTGASGGIGGAIAHALAERGVSLCLTGRDHLKLGALASSLAAASPRIYSRSMDLTNDR